MSEEKKDFELKEKELEKVTGGTAYEYNHHTFDSGTEFVTRKHPDEYCIVNFATPAGLWYTIGKGTTLYSDSYSSLKPVIADDWRDYVQYYIRLNRTEPPVWGEVPEYW